MDNIEVFEVEIEIYNSKMRLLNWLDKEIKLHNENLREDLIEKSRILPLNL